MLTHIALPHRYRASSLMNILKAILFIICSFVALNTNISIGYTGEIDNQQKAAPFPKDALEYLRLTQGQKGISKLEGWGSAFAYIMRTQFLLQELKFYDGKIDGRYSPGTQAAIRDFQNAKGIAADGLISEELLQELEKAQPERAIASLYSERPKFSDYPVHSSFTETMVFPPGIKQIGQAWWFQDASWEGDFRKLITPPHINFAGQYFALKVSCGIDCAFTKIIDLSSGTSLNIGEQLDYGENSPKIKFCKSSYLYNIDFLTIPDSALLLAQYAPIRYGDDEECSSCREQYFVLDEQGELTAVGPMYLDCIRYRYQDVIGR